MQQQVVTELRTFAWEGGRSIVVRQKIVTGPTSFLDRHVNLRLTFEDIECLMQHYEEGKKKVAEMEARVARINRNNEE